MTEQKIFTPEQKQKLKIIAEHYGFQRVIFKLCLECSELLATAKPLWKRAQENNLDKLADIFVILHEIKILLLQRPMLLTELQKFANEKIERQLKEIKEEKDD